MKFLRLLLLPFSLLYALVLRARHFLYDKGLLKSAEFDFPVIVVGNLIVGGAGKSPMTEYLVSVMASYAKIAVLSRGYGRKTNGFRWVCTDSLSTEVGDEPLQIKQKFPSIDVSVCENRVKGVSLLREKNDVVVLDDAFQHRALKGGLNILLFDYHSLSQPKWVLPAGDYRDLFSRANLADAIVVTKCPDRLDDKGRDGMKKRIHLSRDIPVFFSSLAYGELRPLRGTPDGTLPVLDENLRLLLVTGIARPGPLVHFIDSKGAGIDHLSFADHHRFTGKDIARIVTRFAEMDGEQKIILTTEKDAIRLREAELGAYEPFFYYIPIEMTFIGDGKTGFDKLVSNFVKKKM